MRPDVVVCTPGRIIDHLRNSHSVNLDDLDVLVLDEVSKYLSECFVSVCLPSGVCFIDVYSETKMYFVSMYGHVC